MKKICLLIGMAFFSIFTYAQNSEGKSIGKISTREYVVEIIIVDGERRYIVMTKKGEAITNKISEIELANIYPELGQLVQGGVADHAAFYKPVVAENPASIDQL